MKWICYTAIALFGLVGEVTEIYFINGCFCLGIFMLCICEHLEKRNDKND